MALEISRGLMGLTDKANAAGGEGNIPIRCVLFTTNNMTHSA